MQIQYRPGSFGFENEFCFSSATGAGAGAWPVLHASLLMMKRLSLTEPSIFISLVYPLLPKDLII